MIGHISANQRFVSEGWGCFVSDGPWCCCCCMPSENYGRNGVTPIFRSLHRTASSTTGGWSHFNVLLYIILSTTVSFLEDTILFLQGLLFFFSLCTFPLFFQFVYISSFFSVCVHFLFFFACTLCICVMYLTSFDGFF